jgi:hypothetical protein
MENNISSEYEHKIFYGIFPKAVLDSPEKYFSIIPPENDLLNTFLQLYKMNGWTDFVILSCDEKKNPLIQIEKRREEALNLAQAWKNFGEELGKRLEEDKKK